MRYWVRDESQLYREDASADISTLPGSIEVVLAKDYDALAAALRELVAERDKLGEHDRVLFLDDALDRARALLAKMEGKP